MCLLYQGSHKYPKIGLFLVQYGGARTDAWSDVYSLYATLFSALFGYLPEDGLARAMNQEEPTIEDGGDYDPDWSPDGNKILFPSLRNGAPQIFVLDLLNNLVTTLTRQGWNLHLTWLANGNGTLFVTTLQGAF